MLQKDGHDEKKKKNTHKKRQDRKDVTKSSVKIKVFVWKSAEPKRNRVIHKYIKTPWFR